MRIVLLGPPGAGKGTQAELIARGKNIPHISTGEILRAAIVAGSELGEKAKSYLDSGALVPDDLIVSVVGERLLEPDCRSGYLLDGFPRTRGQAEALESFLSVGGHEAVSHVVELVVPDEELLRRVERRAALGSGRSDDNAEVFKKRLKVYW